MVYVRLVRRVKYAMNELKTYGAIGVGGMIGACLRYGVDMLFQANSLLPWSTMLINISGAFLLTFILYQPYLIQQMNPLLQLAVTIGLLGSFTTFSTIILESYLLGGGHILLALLYLFLTIFLGLIASYLGYRFAHAMKLGRKRL